ncbi:toxin [Streptomyces sp. NPDC086080]|uniref:toxin n=1 Tax=Streptomyces sp. NPDC086080 TaxID=3365748 RepID=UPI0037CEEBF1
MSSRTMKALLADLGRDVAKRIQVPAAAEVVMEEFCRAMSKRKNKPVVLLFREFPSEVPVSGLRLVMSDRSLIVIAAGMAPQAQLVILGHELYHEEFDHCSHAMPGLSAAARAVAPHTSSDTIRRAAELVLASEQVPMDAILAVAARSESAHTDEVDAETFGLWFGSEVRTWVAGRYARPRATAATVEGRLTLSLSHRGGRVL